MLILRIGKSKKATRMAMETYNQGKNLAERLRTSHQALIDKLLYYYQQHLSAAQSYGNWQQNSKCLPALRTNNKQLAGALGCSERTIINLRARLKTSGLTAEQWHGSNASYDLWLDLELLHLEVLGNPTNLAPNFQRPTQSLRHTVSCTSTPGTNKLNELSGAVLPQSTDQQSVNDSVPVENAPKAVETAAGGPPAQDIGRVTAAGYKASKPNPARPSNEGRGTPSKKFREKGSRPEAARVVPAKELPQSLEAVLRHLPRAERDKLQRLSLFMWQAAKNALYDDHWLDARQEEMGRIALAEYLAYSSPKLWKAGAQQMADRFELVRRWIKRRHDAGKVAFVPIPEVYFDFRNEKGFRATKSWYQKHRYNLRKIKDQEILTKAVKEYLRSLEDGAQVGPQEALRRCLQRLGKRSPELVARFKEQIINIGQAAA